MPLEAIILFIYVYSIIAHTHIEALLNSILV
jgi:hypothetical protein